MLRIRTLSENRQSFPVLFKGANGEEHTATLSELNKPAEGQNIFARIFSDSSSQFERVKEGLNQCNRDLLQEQTTIKSFVDAASDIANSYRQTLMANVPTNIAVLNPPTESHDLKNITQSVQTHADDHLEQIRQTMDKISLRNGAINETGIEAGIAEAESAASES